MKNINKFLKIKLKKHEMTTFNNTVNLKQNAQEINLKKIMHSIKFVHYDGSVKMAGDENKTKQNTITMRKTKTADNEQEKD